MGWTTGGGWVIRDLYLNTNDSKSSIHSSVGSSKNSSSSGSSDSGSVGSSSSSGTGSGGSSSGESVASAVSNRLRYLFTDSFASTAVAHNSNVWGLVWDWGPFVSYTTGLLAYVYICHKTYAVNARRKRGMECGMNRGRNGKSGE